MVRAKFKCNEIHRLDWSKDARRYVFNAVSADEVEENRRFAKYTPSGRFEMVIDNPPAQALFELGKYYYFDASAVPEAKPAT